MLISLMGLNKLIWCFLRNVYDCSLFFTDSEPTLISKFIIPQFEFFSLMLISLMGLNILILCFIRLKLLHSLSLDQSIGCNLKRKKSN